MKLVTWVGLPIATFAVCALLVEFGTRIIFDLNGMHYGIEMWKYAKDMKRVSSIPELGHEHVPNRRGKLMGVDVEINSQGLRDYEYPLTKEPGTYRILVVGDSMTFGWGASFEDTYAKILERMLNEKRPKMKNRPQSITRYEVINTGVGNYNTVQEFTYFKEIGIKYDPDMVILGFYLNDAEETPVRVGGWIREHSYAFILLAQSWDVVMRALGKRKPYEQYYLDLYSEEKKGWQDCQRALKEFISLCKQKTIELRIIIIPELHSPNDNYRFGKVHRLVSDIGTKQHALVFDLLPAFKGVDPPTLWVTKGDPHPSAHAHKIIAQAIYQREWGTTNGTSVPVVGVPDSANEL